VTVGDVSDPEDAGAATSPCPSCGLEHVVPVEHVVVGRAARSELGRFLDERGLRRVLVVEDANTAEVLGDDLSADLAAAGHVVSTRRFAQRAGLLADEDAVGAVRDAIASRRPDVVLAVGSGVLTDVTRYATFLHAKPFVSVPTAPSMDGYASTVAAMQFDGVKITLPSHAPLAIFADTGVLAAAPREMILSGFGDLAGKASARFDWELAAGLAGEPYCEAVAERVAVPLEQCLEDTAGLLAGDEGRVASLTGGLVESGLAMAMVGNSRPASGCEHHASHFLDLLAFRGLRAHAAHGLQVAYATRFALAIQRLALENLGDPLLQPAGGGGGEDERWWFGEQYLALGPVHDEKQVWFAEHADAWPGTSGHLAEVHERLARSSARFERVGTALGAAGVPATTGFLGTDGAMLRATFRYANRIRSRFTVLDLLESQRHIEPVLDAVIPGDS